MKILNKLLGDEGERYVKSQFDGMGIKSNILGGNSKGVDIIATGNGKDVKIQVKASRGRNNPRQWDVGRYRPDSNKYFFYVFLNLWDDPNKENECFVIPSEFVARTVNWERVRPQFKLSRDKEFEFLNKWELISNLLKEY